MFYWISANQSINNFNKHSARQAVRQRSLRDSEQNVHIKTAMLGQISTLMGVSLQAINIAIYDAIEIKKPVSKAMPSTKLKQTAST